MAEKTLDGAVLDNLEAKYIARPDDLELKNRYKASKKAYYSAYPEELHEELEDEKEGPEPETIISSVKYEELGAGVGLGIYFPYADVHVGTPGGIAPTEMLLDHLRHKLMQNLSHHYTDY